MRITLNEFESEKRENFDLYPCFKTNERGVVVLLVNETSGLIVKKGENSTLGVGHSFSTIGNEKLIPFTGTIKITISNE